MADPMSDDLLATFRVLVEVATEQLEGDGSSVEQVVEAAPALLAEVERLREEERRQRETAEAASRGWRIEVAEVERLRAEQDGDADA